MAAPKKNTDAAQTETGKVGREDGYVFRDEMTDAERATYYPEDGEKTDGDTKTSE